VITNPMRHSPVRVLEPSMLAVATFAFLAHTGSQSNTVKTLWFEQTRPKPRVCSKPALSRCTRQIADEIMGHRKVGARYDQSEICLERFNISWIKGVNGLIRRDAAREDLPYSRGLIGGTRDWGSIILAKVSPNAQVCFTMKVIVH